MINLIESLGTSAWAQGFKAVSCSNPDCSRWLTQRQLSVRRFGVTMGSSWYCGYPCFSLAAEHRFTHLLSTCSSTRKHSAHHSLGLALVRDGLLTDAQYKHALHIQAETGEEIGDVVTGLGLLTEMQVAILRSERCACPVFPSTSNSLHTVHVPTSLLREHSMLPLHYTAAGNKLFVGFTYGVEYGPLHAIEQIIGCFTQPCIITRSHFDRVRQQQQAAASKEIIIDKWESSSEMALTLCNYGRSINADKVSIALCGHSIWTRLKSGTKISDLLFSISQPLSHPRLIVWPSASQSLLKTSIHGQ